MSRDKNQCGIRKPDSASASISNSTWVRTTAAFVSCALLVLALSFGLRFFFGWLNDPHTLPFKTLKIITHSHYLDQKKIYGLIDKGLDGGFFSFDENKIRSAVLSDPWVSSVGVRRVFPATLIVSVDAYKPLAFWNDGSIVTQSGKLIALNGATHLSLPHFFGPDDSMQDVMAMYQQLNPMLKSLHFSIVRIILNARLSWQVYLNNGLDIVLGRENIQQRFRRFSAAYPVILARHGGIMHHVDLRYTNGIAVSWSAAA